MSWSDDVKAFHRKFGFPVREYPVVPAEEEQLLRMGLIVEEYEELLTARGRKDLVGIADGAIDLIYVILGMLHTYGIDPAPVWEEVQKTNMRKEGGAKSPNGKLLKPPGWRPPNIREALVSQAIVYLSNNAPVLSRQEKDTIIAQITEMVYRSVRGEENKDTKNKNEE